MDWSEVRDLVTSDLDRDGDLDLLVAHGGGLAWLDNLRQGRFAPRRGGFEDTRADALAVADLDNDGLPEVIAAGAGLAVWGNRGDGKFAVWRGAEKLAGSAELRAVVAFDADNDGRLDLAAAGPETLVVLRQRAIGGFDPVELESTRRQAAPGWRPPISTATATWTCSSAAITASTGSTTAAATATAGCRCGCAASTRATPRTTCSATARWSRCAPAAPTSFARPTATWSTSASAPLPRADLLRVVWTNGVPQNRLEPESDQWIVEEQVLKGSCPFLYAWDGERFSFVTDLLWGAPAGLPFAPGVWAPSDPHEIVLVEGTVPVDGVYKLRVTEELWEAAFFDLARLWVVDHPAGRRGGQQPQDRARPGGAQDGAWPAASCARWPPPGTPPGSEVTARVAQPRRRLRRRLAAESLPGRRRRALGVHLRPRRRAGCGRSGCTSTAGSSPATPASTWRSRSGPTCRRWRRGWRSRPAPAGGS